MAPVRTRARRVVAEEADPSALLRAGLGLGDVVEQRGQPERLPPRESAAQGLVQVRPQRRAPRGERIEIGEQQVHALDRPDRMLPDVEPMRQRLRGGAHRRALG